MTTQFNRIGGSGAIGFATMIVLGNLITVPAGHPSPGADPAEASRFVADHGGLVQWSSALTPIAWFGIVLFAAGAFVVLWPLERRRGEAWSVVGVAGLLLQTAVFVGVIGARLAVVQQPGEASALWPLQDALLTINGTFLAVALIGLSIAGFRCGLIRRWHQLLGFAAATPTFASAVLTPLVIDRGGVFGLIGLTGWLLWVAWLLAYGTALIKHRPQLGS
ncbi:hypothetical protein ACFTSF_11595 [Kribbella sp. NPDC056951]|uniref:hypothetical protein n=1 Tax=Kribbella sp. NPDC056951 TaxID=3345978 RepID=UPI00362B715F